MGLEEGSWSGDSSETRTPEQVAADAAKLESDRLAYQAQLQSELDAKANLSLAHAREAERNFGDTPKDAVSICTNGWVTIMAQLFKDNSVLIFQVGEMGIENILAFVTMAEAQEWLNALTDFDPCE